jgi:hypothetical protein
VDRLHRPRRERWIHRQRRLSRVRLHRNDRERMSHNIVHFPGDPGPLGIGGGRLGPFSFDR